jgi:hypothetical protein
MPLLPINIRDLVIAEKRLLRRPIWDSRSDARYHVFTAPLILADDPTSGFELRAKASKAHMDRDCMMQLEFSRGGRDRTELARSQWRPFEIHTNRGWGPLGHELRQFVRQSHFHAFDDNYIADERRMRAGSLPAALPIDPDPATLSEFIAFCGVGFRIVNIGVIELPHQNPDMFWVRHDPDE